MPIFANPKTAAGVIHDMTVGQDLTVNAGILIYSTDDIAVLAIQGAGSVVRVNGTVMGFDDAISLNTPGGNHKVIVGATGRVFGLTDHAISIEGTAAFVQNAGLIQGESGILVAEGGTTVSQIVNTGAIIARTFGVESDGARLVLRNSGEIIAKDGARIVISFSGGDLKDRIFNSGLMVGDIQLGGGDDLYVGTGGSVVGAIFGGDGEDVFRPGRSAESIDGGDEPDTLDFRAGPGLRVNLGDGTQNTGAAKGDRYVSIENVLGSNKGNDTLIGDEAEVTLRGFGGKDRLLGGTNDDFLVGGRGKDNLDGRLGSDTYAFFNLNEMGDNILFSNDLGDDTISIAFDALNGSVARGTLAEFRFHTSNSNQAGDRTDRFIFEVDSTRLWFDRDGSKAKFDPVLVANLQAGALFAADDIFIFPILLPI